MVDYEPKKPQICFSYQEQIRKGYCQRDTKETQDKKQTY